MNFKKTLVSGLAALPLLFGCIHNAKAQGFLTNGWTYSGIISSAGQSNIWTFNANAGDGIVVAMGATNGNLYPYLRIYGPNGALLNSGFGPNAAEASTRATNSGTFSVVAANYDPQVNGGNGAYDITLGITASPIVVAPGTQGGAMTNGFTYHGTLLAGQLSVWSFSANVGDGITAAMGATDDRSSLYPYLRIYGPNGALLNSGFGPNAAEVSAQATNSGTFTVVAANYDPQVNGGNGAYDITLGTTASPIVVAPGTQGGAMTNGFTYQGTLLAGQLSVWSFSANAGDGMTAGMGATDDRSSLYPYLRIYGPNGALLNSGFGPNAAEVSAQATNSGTFTVVAANYDPQVNGGNGAYDITLGTTASPIVVAPGAQGGRMTNGFTYHGTLLAGQLSVWSFTANIGDSAVAGLGATGGSLYPYLRLYGPNGALLSSTFGQNATEVGAQATNSGTFTVVAANYDPQVNGGNGPYDLTLGTTASPIVVAPGDQGGPMTNGFTYQGTLLTGQLSVWSFTANTGDSMVAGLGATGGSLYPYLRLYGPNGALLSSAFGQNATEVSARATNSGTFTVVAANFDPQVNGGNGPYDLTLGTTAGPIVVAPGDEGGTMTGANVYAGTMAPGELAVWKFTACTGDNLVLEMDVTGRNGTLYPYLRLYGPNGVLVAPSFGQQAARVSAQATNSGTFTVVAANYDPQVNGGNGTYVLTVNGLSGGLKDCLPILAGTNLNLSAVGGPPGRNFVLCTTTNLATPVALWTPIVTNPFDQFGVFDYTNAFNRAERQRYFRLTPAP
jgi:trimeric autotransporter adhesin